MNFSHIAGKDFRVFNGVRLNKENVLIFCLARTSAGVDMSLLRVVFAKAVSLLNKFGLTFLIWKVSPFASLFLPEQL